RYKELSDDLIVLPAHYSFVDELGNDGSVKARLGDLYQRNSGLQVEDAQDFRKMVTENLPPQPNEHDNIRQTNMGKMNPEAEKQIGRASCRERVQIGRSEAEDHREEAIED